MVPVTGGPGTYPTEAPGTASGTFFFAIHQLLCQRLIDSIVVFSAPPSPQAPLALLNPLPIGFFEPGGCAIGTGMAEGQMFVSNLFFGGVRVVDLCTGEIRVLVVNEIYMKRLAYGMEYHEAHNALFVSGAECIADGIFVGEIRIYDVATGELLSTCQADDASFPTDVAIVDGYAYATNSANNTILRFDIETALSGCCTFETIPLGDTFVPCDDTVNGEFVQGIAGYAGGITFIASENGVSGVYFMDPETLEVTLLAAAPELGGDLLVFNQSLYMSDSELNEIAVFALASADVGNGTVAATRVDTLTSEYYQGPTYLSLYHDEFLYSVNTIGMDTGKAFVEYTTVFASIGDGDGDGGGDGGNTTVEPAPITLLSEIPLGLVHPGGIVAASSGPVLYVTDLFFGGVRVVDLTTGEFYTLHPNGVYLEQTFYGIDLEVATETLFIAGTELVEDVMEGRIYVLDALSGEEIVACAIADDVDFFPTDIALVGDRAYATNAWGSNLVSINVAAAVNGTCEMEIVDLQPVEMFNATSIDVEFIIGTCCVVLILVCERTWTQFVDIIFLLIFFFFVLMIKPTGITGYGDGLIFSSPPGGNNESSAPGLYYYALDANDTVTRIADGPVNGGGLLVVNDTLYVTDTGADVVVVYELTYDECTATVNATQLGVLTSPVFDAPTFSTVYEQSLYTVNSIFNDPETPPETFLLHAVDVTNVTTPILC